MKSKIIKYQSLAFVFVYTLLLTGCSKDDSVNGPPDIIETGIASVDLSNAHQVIRGFGAANILPWRPDMTADQINKAFGTADVQLGFSILRLRIPPDTAEFAMQVSTARQAYAMGVKIIASPWTPPASMKTNDNIVGGELKPDSYTDYAVHLKSFADYMSGNGVPLYAVSIQNEPDVSVTYESCFWNAAQMLNFVKTNAPSIGVKIIADEASNFDHTITNVILNDPAAVPNLSIVGGHLYGAAVAGYPLAASKGKEIWMTEYLDLDTTWTHVLNTGRQINDCMYEGMSAYIWWYIVRFYGPILEDGTISKRGYVMSHYSRFVRPEYVRVGATASPHNYVYITAYKNASKVVIVAVNEGSTSIDQEFSIINGSVTSFTPYVTSSSKNCVQENDIPVSNGKFSKTLDVSSITTFVSN